MTNMSKSGAGFTRRQVLGYGALGVSSVALGMNPVRFARAQEFYAGKTIEIVVPFAEGGVADVSTRFLQPFLTKHLPGNPTINIRNLGGGGSILGANYFEERGDPEALTILSTTSSTAFPFMFGQQGVEYDLMNKRVAYTLGIGPVVYIDAMMGVESATQLPGASGLIYGGIGATGSDLPVLLAFELLGLNVNTVLGFQGRGPARLSMERGETNIDFQFTAAYLTQIEAQVEAGRVVALMTGGSADADGRFTERDPVIADLPSVYEVYREINGADPEGPVWNAFQSAAALTFQYGLTGWLPEGTPDEAVEAFALAAAAVNADPEFEERGREVTGGYQMQPGTDVEANVKAALDLDEETDAYLRELLTGKFGVSL